jgi:hypothetical protein
LLKELSEVLANNPDAKLDNIQMGNLKTLLGKLPKEVEARRSKPKILPEVEEEIEATEEAKETSSPDRIDREFRSLGQFFVDFSSADDPATFLSGKLNESPGSMSDIFQHLSGRTQHSLLKTWHSEKRENFEQRVVNFYRNAMDDNLAHDYFTQAIWRYLMTDDGKAIKNRKLINLGKDVSYVEKNLKEWAEKEIKPETKESAPEEISYWQKIRRKFERMYKFLQIKRKRKSRRRRQI